MTISLIRINNRRVRRVSWVLEVASSLQKSHVH